MTVRCIRCGKLLLPLAFLFVLMFFILSQFTLTASKLRLVQGGLIQRNLGKLPGNFGTNINNWLSKNILRLQWENIHCRRKNDTNIVSQWMKPLSWQLGIQDGQSLFDTNTGCLEWLKYIRKQFPNLRIAGYDEDEDAVDYAKREFNDSSGSFIKRLSQTGNLSVDYALNLGGLQTMRADKQCSKVKAILKTVKPGGTLYLGHNLERNCNNSRCAKCFAKMENVGFVVLENCFWSKTCLKDQKDVVDIFYIAEQDLYRSTSHFNACQTGVFIHKRALISRHTRDNRLRKHLNMYRCY